VRSSAARQRARAALASVFVLAALLPGCRRKHVPIDAIPELGFPACRSEGSDPVAASDDAGVALRAHGDAGAIVAAGHIRSGPWSQEQRVVELFSFQETSCGFTFDGHQEWPLAISDVEVYFDRAFTPLWAWKRMTLPGSKREDGSAEFRVYELRTGDVFIKKRDASGAVTRERLLPGGRMSIPAGARVGAVIGPGRGLLTAWIRRAKLPVGGKARELVLDFRDALESLEVATLERSEDLFEPSFGKKVRVYTFFGRESVFADESDAVIGDLAGMRPDSLLDSPEPEPMPTYGVPTPSASF
jgi:hypothetical protein